MVNVSNLRSSSGPEGEFLVTAHGKNQSINSLTSRNDIVIRKADKGGSVVVWSRDLYIAEALSQLSNSSFYCKLDHDPTPIYQKQVSKTVGDYVGSGELPLIAQRLIEKSPRCSQFYLLPKIHKVGNPGRPIVSTVSCPTSLISAFVDSVLHPIIAQTPSYLKDTTDLLCFLKDFSFPLDPHNNSTFLVTSDVTQLYTVIPHADGLTAAKFFFDSRPENDPPSHVLIRLLELVLTLNAFEFNSEFYSQTSGVAMGTKTLRKLADRFREHLLSIRNDSHTTVSDHFVHNHSENDIMITALVNAPSDEKARLTLENKIIFHFKANKPPGRFLIADGCLGDPEVPEPRLLRPRGLAVFLSILPIPIPSHSHWFFP
ncbi:hypothetical protein Fcan01_18000 [Folsomia candida]|uniref:Reverse transcriptase domain-containing protein n=1 Tax=Folsomia candida TaxID=158441 RepID=A0A226DR63_FOLCA|nr:hypothetical protein Fcan01_18000 [Folsomia candida]